MSQENLPKLRAHFAASFSAGQVDVDEVRAFLEKSGLVSKSSAGVASSVSQHHAAIKSAFSGASVADIFAKLESDGSEFALKTLETLRKMSPLSLCVSCEAIQRHSASGVSLQDALKTEYRLCYACMQPQPLGDFGEGVTALLLEKRAVRWAHHGIDDVSEGLVESYFDPLPQGAGRGELQFA